MENIPDRKSGETGSIPVRCTNVVFSLYGKALGCEPSEQGSNPDDNQCGLV